VIHEARENLGWDAIWIRIWSLSRVDGLNPKERKLGNDGSVDVK